MRDPGLIRHRGKLASVVPNARAFLALAAEHGSFARWLWSFVDGRPVVRRSAAALGVSPEAVAISKELKKRGMKFVGPTIIHALLQAVGVYDEHAKGCFRAKRV
jgi:DNA-3-methyladenine glycosylase I